MKPKTCPLCHLINPETASVCDCGHVFAESMRKIKCSKCGTLNQGKIWCTKCGQPLDPNFTQKEDKRSTPFFTFECVDCGSILRIQLPAQDGSYRCSGCGTSYTSRIVSESPTVILLIPVTDNGSQGKKRRVPPEVSAALSVFNLKADVTFQKIRVVYREQVASYHPDKVAHLGPDLRKLAEAKTKELNVAYQILDSFFNRE